MQSRAVRKAPRNQTVGKVLCPVSYSFFEVSGFVELSNGLASRSCAKPDGSNCPDSRSFVKLDGSESADNTKSFSNGLDSRDVRNFSNGLVSRSWIIQKNWTSVVTLFRFLNYPAFSSDE